MVWSPAGWAAASAALEVGERPGHEQGAALPVSSTSPRTSPGPAHAKRRDTSSWPSARTLTPKMPDSREARVRVRPRVHADEHERGVEAHRAERAHGEARAGGPRASRVVTTVTPLANWRERVAERRASTGIGVGL